MERPVCIVLLVAAANLLLVALATAIVRSQPMRGGAPQHTVLTRSATQQTDDSSWKSIAENKAASSNLLANNLCSNLDLSAFDAGQACGSPLSAPCFDHSRCRCCDSSRRPRPTMYVYDDNCSLADSRELPKGTEEVADDRNRMNSYWRKAAHDAGLLAETYDSACLFVHVNQRVDREPCAPHAPLWNRGANHVMVDLTDYTRCATDPTN